MTHRVRKAELQSPSNTFPLTSPLVQGWNGWPPGQLWPPLVDQACLFWTKGHIYWSRELNFLNENKIRWKEVIQWWVLTSEFFFWKMGEDLKSCYRKWETECFLQWVGSPENQEEVLHCIWGSSIYESNMWSI